MRCEHVRERMVEALLSGEEEIPVGLRAHVEACPECTAEVARLHRGVLVARALPQLGVDPPAEMKARVFTQIGLAEDAAPAIAAPPTPTPGPTAAPESTPRVPSRPGWFRGLILRPLPVAAALLVMALGVGTLFALPTIRDRNARIVYEAVRKSPALTSCDELADSMRADPSRWGEDVSLHQRAVEEARIDLLRVSAAGDNIRDVYRVAESVNTRRLVDSFNRLLNDCPDIAAREKAENVRRLLQDIEDLGRR